KVRWTLHVGPLKESGTITSESSFDRLGNCCYRHNHLLLVILHFGGSMTAVAASLKTGHVGLNVSDLARARQFYQDVLGLELLGQSTDDHPFAFLGRGSDILLTLWQQSEGDSTRNRPGLHHLSFEVDSMDEVR